MKKLEIAVLFLVFNRLDVTKQVFAQIRQAKPTKLYIACDGPRRHKAGEDIVVADLRNYLLSNIDWQCEIKTLFRDVNLGCGKAVSDGISWFFANEAMGIILEDDCIPSQSFFYFCQELLIKYKDDRRIWHISGSSFLDPNDLQDSSYYFSTMSQIWGWATWANRWCEYDIHMKKYDNFLRHRYLDNIANTLRGKIWHQYLFKDNLGKTSNWDCQWYFTILINHGLCVTPKVNLIKNVGFDLADSANVHGKDSVLSAMVNNEIDLTLVHPQTFCVDTFSDGKFFKWRTRDFVWYKLWVKLLLRPLMYIDEKFWDKKLITFYKKIRQR